MTQHLPITFNRQRKTNPRTVKFEMFEPSADAICPITQDPIAESELEFMQGLVYSPAHPKLTGTRLLCGHEFSAMCLLYYWSRNNNVLCPVCRCGPKGGRVNLRKLPVHFRLDMWRRVRREMAQDHEEHLRENEEAARQFDFGHWFVTYVEENPCFCIMLGSDMRGTTLRMTALLENSICQFTAECDEALLRSKDSVRLVGMLVNEFHCQTRFPESTWTKMENSITTYNLTSGSSSVEYLLSMDASKAKITLLMPIFLFQIFAEQHEHVYSLAVSRWAS